MSYELFEQGPSAYIPVLLVSLLITLAVYCAFPLIFACIRKKPITSRKYRVICFCFNFLPCVAFFSMGSSSAWPYILWTSIFSSVGVGMLERNNVLSAPKSSASQESKSE